ncbi:hypothetical protein [Jeotgalibaca sp. A122]|uniref:hypothetical protein n=1 Tax=Jeotgalibaca sp. A122 TaxID=3457322 RepID=UPI003FD2C0F5
MNSYDEYQRFIRYRTGYHSFFLVVLLLLVNHFVTGVKDFQWAEDGSVELLFIILIPGTFMNIVSTWQGAYFNRREKPLRSNLVVLAMGVMYVWLALYSGSIRDRGLVIDGKLTLAASQLMLGLTWVSIPITYIVRKLWDKRIAD